MCFKILAEKLKEILNFNIRVNIKFGPFFVFQVEYLENKKDIVNKNMKRTKRNFKKRV